MAELNCYFIKSGYRPSLVQATGEFRCYLESQGLQVVEHLLLPQQRTFLAKKAWGKLLHTLGRPPHWYSCQLAVCRTR